MPSVSLFHYTKESWADWADGVLYGYAPEVFPTPSRGTGDALAAAASRVTGIFAPVIAVFSNAALTPDGPVFASAGIFVASVVTSNMTFRADFAGPAS